MPTKQKSNVDVWLQQETSRIRKALESASRHFDSDDNLTVNTLEAVYGKESSFGVQLRERGSVGAAGHFHLEKATAERYGLKVSKENDQCFDIHRTSSAATRYLTDLPGGRVTTAVKNAKEYVEKVLRYETEFAIKSPADKRKKQKKPGKRQAWCTEGRWRTIDDRSVFICA